MGLDTLELLMAVEEEFDVRIPESENSRLKVLSGWQACISEALTRKGEVPVASDIWNRLKRVVIDQLEVRPDEVFPEADLVRDLGCK